jgi:hypothetical protein
MTRPERAVQRFEAIGLDLRQECAKCFDHRRIAIGIPPPSSLRGAWIDVHHEQILGEWSHGSHNPPGRIDDACRSLACDHRGTPGHVAANNPDGILDRAGDIAGACFVYETLECSIQRQTVVCRHEQRRRTLGCHKEVLGDVPSAVEIPRRLR